MKNIDLNKVIAWLGQMLKCPVCQTKYKINVAKVIESWSDEIYGEAGMLIHSDCSKCKSSVMFNVEVKGPDVYSVGMITDLTVQDSTKFKKHKPISANDVLAIHTELKSFNGNLINLLLQKN